VTHVYPEATEHLRRLANRLVGAALERVPLRAAMLVGSAGRGDADFYSDLDLLLYVDELPAEETLTQIRNAVGGKNPSSRGEPTEDFSSEEFDVNGVRTEVSFVTVARAEQRLDQLLEDVEEFDSRLQKILSGMLEGLPLHGEDLVERWRGRVRSFPNRCGERWSSDTGTSSRFGTTARRWQNATASCGVSTCCSRRRSICSPSLPP
jgi:predicted nucleotidyltransferase